MRPMPTTPRDPRRRASWLALAALALLGWPGQSFGGCGDYLAPMGDHPARPGHALPCQGPACSRGDVPLPPPPAVQRVVTPSEAWVARPGCPPDGLAATSRPDPTAAPLPTPPVFAIFHPPR